MKSLFLSRFGKYVQDELRKRDRNERPHPSKIRLAPMAYDTLKDAIETHSRVPPKEPETSRRMQIYGVTIERDESLSMVEVDG